MSKSIAQASVFVAELIEVLEDLYWESQSVTVKNQCFNTVRFLQTELTEITKLSVQDHHYEYEIISCSPSEIEHSLQHLSRLLDNETLRTKTRKHLKPLLASAKQFFN